MKTNLFGLVVASATVLSLLPVANAGNGFGGCYGYGGLGYDYGALYNSLQYRVPYFAAHPPVYYSYPVPRTYGYSPFAYPPYVRTPEVVAKIEPATIINPYVPSSTPPSSEVPQDRVTRRKKAPQPLVIHNPYVTGSSQVPSQVAHRN